MYRDRNMATTQVAQAEKKISTNGRYNNTTICGDVSPMGTNVEYGRRGTVAAIEMKEESRRNHHVSGKLHVPT